MSEWSQSKLPERQELSSLMDGELESSAVSRACASWRDDAEARSAWHAYHLIGDALRSDDLASNASGDAAFLAAIRERLAQEPVVLAPSASIPATPPRLAMRRSWAVSAAVAAGFVAVAGVLVVTQMSNGVLHGASTDANLAKAPSELVPVVLADGLTPSVANDLPSVTLNGRLIRDVRLDEYLAAHKKFGGSSAMGGPSGFLRNAAADGTVR